jgi:hypothetical protein
MGFDAMLRELSIPPLVARYILDREPKTGDGGLKSPEDLLDAEFVVADVALCPGEVFY